MIVTLHFSYDIFRILRYPLRVSRILGAIQVLDSYAR